MTKIPGIWEQLNNPDFKPVEFDGIRMQTGLNSFTLTPNQWKAQTKDMDFADISNLRKSAQSVDKISSDNPQISQIRADKAKIRVNRCKSVSEKRPGDTDFTDFTDYKM